MSGGMFTVNALLRHIEARCAVCGGPVDGIGAELRDYDNQFWVTVSCHGRKDVHVIERHTLVGTGVIILAFTREAAERKRWLHVRQHARQSRGRRSAVRNRWRFEA